MTLYEMTAEMTNIINALENEELTDEEREQIVADMCECIGADEKIDSYCKIIREYEGQQATCEAEAKRLTARAKAIDSYIERMKKAVGMFMEATGKEKVDTGLFKTSFCKSESVNITDEATIPMEFMRSKTEVKPDKTAIKNAIKAGQTVAGAELVPSKSVVIK